MGEKRPVCLITGLGDGTGGACARRFHKGGYRLAMLARTQERLDRFEAELEGSRGYQCNVMDLDHTCEITAGEGPLSKEGTHIFSYIKMYLNFP